MPPAVQSISGSWPAYGRDRGSSLWGSGRREGLRKRDDGDLARAPGEGGRLLVLHGVERLQGPPNQDLSPLLGGGSRPDVRAAVGQRGERESPVQADRAPRLPRHRVR